MKKKIFAFVLSILVIFDTLSIPVQATGIDGAGASRKETLNNGYQIDMNDLPQVYFADHPEWTEIYDAAWNMHKSNIKKANTSLNPEDVYYVDEAFNNEIYAWDTMFMMLFDKYGCHQFPTLQSLDNFYYSQFDNENYNAGAISGEFQDKASASNSYYDNSSYDTHNQGVKNKPEATTGLPASEMKSSDFVQTLNAAAGNDNFWKMDEDGENSGYPVFQAQKVLREQGAAFSGAGTEEDPILITSIADLERLAEQVNSGRDSGQGKYYLLTQDLVFEGKNNHIPIGTEEHRFQGVFDGGYHTVTGIHIATDQATQGLFGYVYDGTVRNIGVLDLHMEAKENSAGIAGQAKGNSRIENCYVRNSRIHTKYAAAAGIAGLLEGTSSVENCYITDSFIGGRAYVGGIAGLARAGEPAIRNSYVSCETKFNGAGYIFRKRNESDGNTYYDYTNVLGLNPPLWAWAEWEQYKIHGDVSRFTKEIKGKTIYTRLKNHFDFVEREKKMENGLYGKTSGDANGLDDSPNQDFPWVTATGGEGKQTYNDLSIQQAQAAYYIALIAKELGNTEDYNYYMGKHDSISRKINELMWDDEEGMYSNLDTDGSTHTNISTPTNLWALIGRVATEERAGQIIRKHALNSEKLFRPNGLATSAYDYPGDENGRSAFSPLGKYWNGSIWSPSSYQYIKGLQESGYGDIAFEEAIRHINTVYQVYQNGFAGINSIWECYSPEYLRPATSKNDAGQSRYNFVGWTGCLAIGTVIEDILGLDVTASKNTIRWEPRLIEENGITGLWYATDGEENRVDIQADERKNETSDLNFTVRCTRGFTLTVNNGGVEETWQLEAGEHHLTARGTNTDQKKPYLHMEARELDTNEAALTESSLRENASDYITFQTEQELSIDDGIGYQKRKTDGNLIYNVNTVGYRMDSASNPVSLRESRDMQALGFENAMELVRKSVNAGGTGHSNDGFMAMVPADNEVRTMELVVGVKNTTAVLSASLSDGSYGKATIGLSAQEEEKTYVVEVPYCSSGSGHNLSVDYRITAGSRSDAEISLKGIVLREGGTVRPSALKNVAVDAKNGELTVTAENPADESYDSYIVSVSRDGENPEKYPVSEFPYKAELENFSAYEVTVMGVRDGVEGIPSAPVSGIMEPEGTGDADRARVDLEKTLPQIKGDNTSIQELTSNLKLDGVKGKLYGTEFILSSSTDGELFGLSNEGMLTRPIQPMKAIPCKFQITASLNGATYTKEFSSKIQAVDAATEPYAYGSDYKSPLGNIDLTQKGNEDWIQLCTQYDTDYARKNVETPLITDFTHLDASYTETAGDVPAKYSFTDAASGTQPNNLKGIVSKTVGNGFSFRLPNGSQARNVTIFAGVYRAAGKVQLLVNGNVLYTGYVSENAGSLTLNSFRLFDITYTAPGPDDIVEVRYTMTKDLWGAGMGGSLILPCVMLSGEGVSLPCAIGEEKTVIEAENYYSKQKYDTYKEPCGDTGNGLSLGGIPADETFTYLVDVKKSGTYDVTLRLASAGGNVQDICILADGREAGRMTETVATGGWQTYRDYVISNVFLKAGTQVLEVKNANAGFNMNYLSFELKNPGAHMVEFESCGGSEVSPYVNVENGQLIREPEKPAKGDYIFGGWYKDPNYEELWDFSSDVVNADLVLYARWMDGQERAMLAIVINAYKDLNTEVYTDESAEAFANALEEAQSIYRNEEATGNTIMQAVEKLLKAAAELVFDTSDMSAAIEAADQAARAADQAAQDALRKAEENKEAAALAQQTANAAQQAAEAARAQAAEAEKAAKKSMLTVVYNAYKDVQASGYTAESKKALTDAVAAAETVLANESADGAAFEQAAEGILKAAAGLVIDTSDLEQAAESARQLAEAAQQAADEAKGQAALNKQAAELAQQAADAAEERAQAAEQAAREAKEELEKAKQEAREELEKAQQEAKEELEKTQKEAAAQREELAKLAARAEAAQKAAEEARAKAEAAEKAALEAKAAYEKAQQKEPVQPETPIKTGEIYKNGDYSYRVLDAEKMTAEITGVINDKLTKLNIYSSVTLGGKSYKVTSVGAEAFKGNKKVTSAVIGRNVETIGADAFAGCAKLKKVTIKSTKLKEIGSRAFAGCKKLKSITIKSRILKKVGANAFRGIYKKAAIKVPAAKYKAYAKLLAKKGQSKAVKIKK